MANTFTQIYIQVVFAVKGRQNLISKGNKDELSKYISGIVTNREQKLLAVHCMPDHVHILIGLKPTITISDLVRDIKAGSSKFINDQCWIRGKFRWQEGFGAFSYAHKELSSVIRYIENQEQRHAKQSFKEEYLESLESFQIDYDEQYLFDWL